MSKQTLKLLPQEFTIHSLDSDAKIPPNLLNTQIFFISKTEGELSIVCPSEIHIDSFAAEKHWLALEVVGPLDFSLTGILSNISGVLAKESISIFAISTYDTDYILVKQNQVELAITALKNDGYSFL